MEVIKVQKSHFDECIHFIHRYFVWQDDIVPRLSVEK